MRCFELTTVTAGYDKLQVVTVTHMLCKVTVTHMLCNVTVTHMLCKVTVTHMLCKVTRCLHGVYNVLHITAGLHSRS
jgi:hypothetical protein